MDHAVFLQDLAVVMCVAAFATVLFRQFNQPVVLGYILAGVIIGPHTPPFELIHDEHTVKTLAELGIIFLMFSLGLEFSLRKLTKVGATAFIAAFLEILLMILAGYELGRLFGWKQMDCVFLGAILAISSTTIIIKALDGLGKSKEPFARLIFGILIVEDILAIIMLALLSGYATSGEFSIGEIGSTVLKLSSFLGVLLVAGLILVPRLLNYVGKFKSDEMLLITVLGLCFGVCIVTVKLGYSVALGAFLIGAVIAEARQIVKIESLMIPVRDMFSAVFFVSIGLQINPAVIIQYIVPILIITGVVIVGKVIACSFGTFVAGNDTRTSLKVGMGLSQIGEFSFIIASTGLALKVTSEFLYPIAVAVSALTTLATPYLIKSADGTVSLFDRVAPKPVMRGLDAYSEWVAALGSQGAESIERKLISKLFAQILVNLLLVTAIFISAIFLYDKLDDWWPKIPLDQNGQKGVGWLAAMVCSLPLLIAVWRKMEVGAMLVSEMTTGAAHDDLKGAARRTFIHSVLTVAGTGALVIVVLLLSTPLLPSWNILALAALIVGVVGFLLYRTSVTVYAGANSALQGTFAEPHDAPTHDQGHGHEGAQPPQHSPVSLPVEASTVPGSLRDAKLLTLELGSSVTGKKIGQMALRTKTGASVIGIERGSRSIVNPGANEELFPGDRILLFGKKEHLDSAKTMLGAE